MGVISMGTVTLENGDRFVLAAFCEDFSATLNVLPNSYTEIAFAAPDGSAFNQALYSSPLTTETLYRAMEENRNVAFLNGCKKNQMPDHFNALQKRAATNSSIGEKNILSFDADCKDFVPDWMTFSPEKKRTHALTLYSSLEKKIEAHNLPLWIVLYSGNGFHFHFKTSAPVAIAPTYRESYLSILAYLQEILAIPFDPICCNPARLMRLPLSTNWKEAKSPIQTKILAYNAQADAASFLLPFWKKTLKTFSPNKEKSIFLEKLSLQEILTFFSYEKFSTWQETPENICCSSPWKTDTTPSFYFSRSKKLFYDFSAGKGGDLFTLIAELAQIDCRKDFKTVLQYAKKILKLPEASQTTPVGSYTLKDSGVWFREASQEGQEQGTWVCSYIEVIGYTRDRDSVAWGRLLRIRDVDGKEKTWAMPMEYLAGDAMELRKKLLHMGVQLNPCRYARHHVPSYICAVQPTERIRCVSRMGWAGAAFHFPDQVYATQQNEEVLFQGEWDCSVFTPKGDLCQWQEAVAKYCAGNSRLILALCAAFAPPLLYLTGEENFGIHLVGPSSIGKTIALTVAGSVWGGGKLRGYGSRWRSTANGLEGLAQKHNDALLVLDELAEVAPHEAGDIAYMLANGSGKARGTKEGGMKEGAEWRLVFLSAGEIELATHMQGVGGKIQAGQEVRMIALDADAGKGLGILEVLHKFQSSGALVDHLRTQSLQQYGTPIRAFVETLVADDAVPPRFQESLLRFKARFATTPLHGQQLRVLHRFHLLAFAGELAGLYGVLPFGNVDAVLAQLYGEWISKYEGSSDLESHRILTQVRTFLQRYGVTHFPELTDGSHVQKCFGFRKQNSLGAFDWLIPSEIFREEVCKGYDLKRVLHVLKQGDYLAARDTKNSHSERLPNLGVVRVYQLTAKILHV